MENKETWRATDRIDKKLLKILELKVGEEINFDEASYKAKPSRTFNGPGFSIDFTVSEENGWEKVVSDNRPKTWEELVRISGAYIDKESDVRNVTVLSARLINRNVFSTEQEAEASIALAQLSQLRKVYRDGWEPDWGDRNSKWCIKFYDQDYIVVNAVTSSVSFLSFQSGEVAETFLLRFRDLINKAKPLMS